MGRWLRAVRLLNLTSLRRRKARAALAVLACAAGVGLLSAVALTQHSVTTSVAQVSRSLAGPTPLRVIGPSDRGGLQDSVVASIRSVAGVQAAVPVVQTIAEVRGARGKVLVLALGVDCSIESVVGHFGCTSQAIRSARVGDAPLIGPGLLALAGRGATLRTDLGDIPLAHASHATPLARVNSGRIAVFALPQAQQEFLRVGRLDAVYVVPKPGTGIAALRARIRAVLPVQDQVLRADQAPPGTQDAILLIPLLGLIGIMTLGIAGLLVFNVLSLTLAERRRELAVASALGSRQRLVVGATVFEGVLIGLAGGLVGAALGIPFAVPVVATLSQQVAQFTGVHLRLAPSLTIAAMGPLVGAVTAGIAAYGPARRATRLDIARELHARTPADRPTSGRQVATLAAMLGLSALGVVAALAAGRHFATQSWQPPLGTVAALVTMASTIGVTVALTPLVLRAVLPWARTRGNPVAVAVRQLVAQPRRAGIAAAAVATPVAFASLLAAALPAINHQTVLLFDHVVDGRVYVSTTDFNNTSGVDSKTPPAVVKRLRALPGVASVDAETFVFAPVNGVRTSIGAMERVLPSFQVIEGAARPADVQRGEVLIGPGLAREQHLHPGSMVSVDGLHGRMHVRVAGVWADPNDVGVSMMIGMPQLVALFGPQAPEALFVRPVAGLTPERLAATIRAAHLAPGLLVQTPSQFLNTLAASVRAMLDPFWALQRASLIIALMGTLSTLMLVGVQRRQELGVLAAVGLSPRGLARLTLADATVIGVIGGVLGIAASLPTLIAMLSDAVFVAGSGAPFQFDLLAALRYVVLALGVVLIGAAWPAWRTSRLQVAEALRAE